MFEFWDPQNNGHQRVSFAIAIVIHPPRGGLDVVEAKELQRLGAALEEARALVETFEILRPVET